MSPAGTETKYDLADPAVRAALVGYIVTEQEEIDGWRAIQTDGTSKFAHLAPGGIEAAQAVMAKFMALLAGDAAEKADA